MSSDGILRLDLDFEGAMMPNGSHYVDADGADAPGVPTPLSAEPEEEPQTEPEPAPPKKSLKPPMPPSKEGKPTTAPEDGPDEADAPEKKVSMNSGSTLTV